MGKYNLYTLKYNNYYNRIIKKYDTLDEYLANADYEVFIGANFVPNDWISTEQVLNTSVIDHDYLIAEDYEGNLTRWFIIEQVRERNGQYKLILRRDIVADNYDSVITAPMFIEKATISDLDDPAIYNQENMTFNQIKVDERPLNDDTQVPWIVGYVARPGAGQTDPLQNKTITTKLGSDEAGRIYEEVAGIANWPYHDKPIMYSNVFAYTTLTVMNTWGWGTPYTTAEAKFNRTIFSTTAETYSDIEDIPDVYRTGYQFSESLVGKFKHLDYWLLSDILKDDYYNKFDTYIRGVYPSRDAEDILIYQGKLIKDTLTNRVYKVNIETTTVSGNWGFREGSDALNYLKSHITLNNLRYEGAEIPNNSWGYYAEAQKHTIYLEEVLDEITLSFGTNRDHLIDQPFDMFCIPAGKVQIATGGVSPIYDSDPDVAIRIAQEIMAELGSAIYDIQLLPYCPIQSMISYAAGIGAINVQGQISVPINKVVNEVPVEISRLVWCNTSKFSFIKEIELGFRPRTALDKKVRSLTQKYRLCAPNYSAAFDIDPMKNNFIDSYQIDCMYKPFTPYIHVAPVFNEGSLYGGDYHDARGLICGGGFSISRVDSAWTQYKLNNINYEKTFQRQIENLELTQDIESTMQLWGIAAGTLQGVGTGAAVGSAGGPLGAAIGGAAAGTASLAGGIADYYYGEQLRDEAKSLQKDMYGFNMGNIKAIPNTLAKVDAFDPNNKIFPFIEIYECTEKEREALINKIKYNGMSIGRIGSIMEFLQPEPTYIKGQLIRLSVGDFHETNAIAGELSKGVFI